VVRGQDPTTVFGPLPPIVLGPGQAAATRQGRRASAARADSALRVRRRAVDCMGRALLALLALLGSLGLGQGLAPMESEEAGAGAAAPLRVFLGPNDARDLPGFSLGGQRVQAVGRRREGDVDVGLVFVLTADLLRGRGLEADAAKSQMKRWRASDALKPYLHGTVKRAKGVAWEGELVDDVGLVAILVQLKVPEGEVRSLRDAVATFLAPSAPRAPRVTVDAARTYLAAHPKLLLENLRANPKLVADLMDEPEMDGVREASVLMAFDIISDALELFSGLVLSSAGARRSLRPPPLALSPFFLAFAPRPGCLSALQ